MYWSEMWWQQFPVSKQTMSQGRIQDFQIQLLCIKSAKRDVPAVKGTVIYRVLDTLSCYLSLILYHSGPFWPFLALDFKTNYKVDRNLEWAPAIAPPPGSDTVS